MSKKEEILQEIAKLESKRDSIITKMTQLTPEDLDTLNDINNTLFDLREEYVQIK